MSCFVIAEAGVNHNGSRELALRLVEVAAEAGADAVKFQTFRADSLVKAGVAKADYQRAQTGEGDQHSMLKALELSHELHEELVARCRELNIEFMSTPFDRESADYLIRLGVRRMKIPSGELTNLPFIERLASSGLPLIMSTGMADLVEVTEAVAAAARGRERGGFAEPLTQVLTLLHCTSSYPAAAEDVNLLAMRTLAERCGLPVGYSDHTADTAVAVAAVALGAQVIEKHFTLDRNLPGPDHKASLEPDQLARMIRDIRTVEAALGDGDKRPRPVELPVRDLVRRSVVVNRDLPAGTVLSEQDLVLLRPGIGLPPKALAEVVGRRLAQDIAAGTLLAWEHLA